MHGALVVGGLELLHHAFQWGKTGASSHEDDWACRVLDIKAAHWPLDTEQGFFLHFVEDMGRKMPARYVADMQLQKRLTSGCIGE